MKYSTEEVQALHSEYLSYKRILKDISNKPGVREVEFLPFSLWLSMKENIQLAYGFDIKTRVDLAKRIETIIAANDSTSKYLYYNDKRKEGRRLKYMSFDKAAFKSYPLIAYDLEVALQECPAVQSVKIIEHTTTHGKTIAISITIDNSLPLR